MLKTITINESKLEYDIIYTELNIVLGLSFYYKDGKLMMNQNPFGDRKLKLVSNIDFRDDYSEFKVQCEGGKNEYRLVIKNEWDIILAKLLADILINGIDFPQTDIDKIELVFYENTDIQCDINRYINKKFDSGFLLTRSEGELFYIQEMPEWKKTKLVSVELNNGILLCRSISETFSWELKVQPKLLNVIQKALASTLNPLHSQVFFKKQTFKN